MVKLTIIAVVLLFISVGVTVWWMVQSDWYDKGMMDE